jgi:CheY-like chemotaxis protein
MANQICSTAYYEEGGSKVTFFMKYETKEMIGGFIHSEEAMLSKMSLLYVEDDHAIRQQFARIIQRMVGELHVAADGREGLEIYRMEHPDIVLTDIEMPRMNGLDMAEKIKAINHDQSILIMTAYNHDDKFLRAIDIGVDKYVIKPVKIEQLKNALYTIAKQIFFKREAMRLMKEKEQQDARMLMFLQSENRYALAQQEAAFKKQELIIHDDSRHFVMERCKVFYKPLERLSGDIYGVFRIDASTTLLYIIDSMGKGLAASVTAVLSAAYINRSVEMALQNGRFDFSRLITDYRDYIRTYLLDDECISFSMVLINLEQGEFTYSSFGMYPMLLKDCETLAITEHRSNNAPFTKYLPEIIISAPLPLPAQFGIFLFSDGLVETELFGMQELLYHLKVGQEEEEITLFNKVMDKSFVADDDVTLIHFSSGCENS